MMKNALLTMAVAAACFSYGAQADEKTGGDIVVTYQNDVATLDPAIGYDWQNWSMIKSLFDGLMDYRPGTTELVNDLAESYAISEDGKVYTFVLRKGVKFHNGREVTAADVKYSLERTVNPKTQSPGAGFFSPIAGYDEEASGKSTTLSGIEVVDDHTVKITLKEPNATFLHVLALNFASVVPREEVEKWGADFGKHPVGSGAFELQEWKLGQELIFRKNPNYFKAGVPRLDHIKFEMGQDPSVALLRLEKAKWILPATAYRPHSFCRLKTTRPIRA